MTVFEMTLTRPFNVCKNDPSQTGCMKNLFYIGTGMQLFGLAAVGLCFFAGVKNGDYGQLELAQLIIGSLVFYIGHYLKGKSAS